MLLQFYINACMCALPAQFFRQKGRTGLIQAALCGHEEVVRLLLDLGADVNLPDKVKRDPVR